MLVYVISWPFGRRDSHVVVCFDGVTPITNQRISLKRPNKLWRKYNGKGLHELYTLHSFVCSITTFICNHVVIITILFCFPDPVQIALPSGIGYFRLINMQAMNILWYRYASLIWSYTVWLIKWIHPEMFVQSINWCVHSYSKHWQDATSGKEIAYHPDTRVPTSFQWGSCCSNFYYLFNVLWIIAFPFIPFLSF